MRQERFHEILGIAVQLLARCSATITHLQVPAVFDASADHKDVIVFPAANTLTHGASFEITHDITMDTINSLLPFQPSSLTYRSRVSLDLSVLHASLRRVTIHESHRSRDDAGYAAVIWRLPLLQYAEWQTNPYAIVMHAPMLATYHTNCITIAQLRAILLPRRGGDDASKRGATMSRSLTDIKWRSLTNQQSGRDMSASLPADAWPIEQKLWLDELALQANTTRISCLPNLQSIEASQSSHIPLPLLECMILYGTRLEHVEIRCKEVTGDHIWTIMAANRTTLRTMNLLQGIDGKQQQDDTTATADSKHVTIATSSYDDGRLLEMVALEEFTIDIAVTWLSHLQCPVLTMVTHPFLFFCLCPS